MTLFSAFNDPQSVVWSVLVLSLVAGLGQWLGGVKIRGLGLGIAGVLFMGLVFGHFGATVNAPVLDFVREFGLVLFVFATGLQVGPGFVASLRREGLPLNLMAAGLVAMNTLMAIAAFKWGGVPVAAAVGVLSGATTNTSSLGAAQQALLDVAGTGAAALGMPGAGYAVAYPFGVIGTILSLLLLRRVFKISPADELARYTEQKRRESPALHTVNLEVTNANLAGIPLGRMLGLPHHTVAVSRLWRQGQVIVPGPETILAVGDVILAVGPKDRLDDLRVIVGRHSDMDLQKVPSTITSKRVVVTQKAVLGSTLGELQLPQRFNVNVTRLGRMDLEFPADPQLRLNFGDTVIVVGEPDAIRLASQFLGNSPRQLNDPQIIALLLGIALGVVVGSLPLAVPGLPAPVRLGLAGGPLIVAIALARVGKIGRIVWHMPISANFMIRELGISLFLACVGLRAGGIFVDTLVAGDGVRWVLWGAAITVVPLLVVGCFARAKLKLNFTALTGFMAGAMTSPPSLSFSNSYMASEYPALSYAAVYPLTMLLRVLSTQALVLFFFR